MNTPKLVSCVTVCLIAVLPPAEAQYNNRNNNNPKQRLLPNTQVTTTDVEQGVQKYIDRTVAANHGHFPLKEGAKPLELTLVKIQSEQLTSLDNNIFVACVDFQSQEGKPYDVDFYLRGRPGAMVVTQTALHKADGKALYTWEQRKSGNWYKAPVKPVK